jgi:hypothetical protein
LYDLLRAFHKKQWEATLGDSFEAPSGELLWAAKRDAQRIAFSKLTKRAKAKMAKQLVAQEDLAPDMVAYVRTLGAEVPKGERLQRIQGKCVS